MLIISTAFVTYSHVFLNNKLWDDNHISITLTCYLSPNHDMMIYMTNVDNEQWQTKLNDNKYKYISINNKHSINSTYIEHKLNCYKQRIYILLTSNLLRTLTFNLITTEYANVYICDTNCDMDNIALSTEFSKYITKPTFTYTNGSTYIYSKKTNIFTKYTISSKYIFFIILNIIIDIIVLIYVNYLFYNIVYTEWTTSYISFSNTYYPHVKDMNKLNNYRFEAFGILFLIDNTISSTHNINKSMCLSILRALVHFVGLSIITIPLLFIVYYSTIKYIDEIILYATYAYILNIIVYSFMYYINIRWKIRKYYSYIFYVCIIIYSELSILYVINSCLWFILSIYVAPNKSITILSSCSSLGYYINNIYTNVKQIRNDVIVEIKNVYSDSLNKTMSTTPAKVINLSEDTPNKYVYDNRLSAIDNTNNDNINVTSIHISSINKKESNDNIEQKILEISTNTYNTSLDADMYIIPQNTGNIDQVQKEVVPNENVFIWNSLNEYGLGMRKIIFITCTGIFIIIMVSIWVILTCNILGVDDNIAYNILSASIIPFFTKYAKTLQIKLLEKKISKKSK
jgi:hypothetical protein